MSAVCLLLCEICIVLFFYFVAVSGHGDMSVTNTHGEICQTLAEHSIDAKYDLKMYILFNCF